VLYVVPKPLLVALEVRPVMLTGADVPTSSAVVILGKVMLVEA
jgi:hypothetical protein